MNSLAGLLMVAGKQDEAERAMWVDKYRNSNMTLGEVVEHIFERREAREAGDPQRLMAVLLPCLKPNVFGVLEGQIYHSTRAGTKGSAGLGASSHCSPSSASTIASTRSTWACSPAW